MSTAWSYLPNSGDRRLASIDNTGLSSGQYSNFTFTTTPENFITAIGASSDAATVYPGTLTQSATYNNLNQLTDLSGQALTYDADGNLTSDGQRDYSWDAENRLVAFTYPGEPGKETAFSYDGLGRRTAITSTPAGGGSAVTTSYIWCGSRICQARDSSDAVTREYYAEGELVPGTPAQPYYYGADQIGSVRRAFASTTSAPAYSYDPYGNALQGTAPVTDFGYAGMFYNADSGLYLTQYRVYDPVAGRWLSRDPSGEASDPVGNLYRYANDNPVVLSDPNGRFGIIGAVIGGAVGAVGAGAGNALLQYASKGCVNWSQAGAAAALGGTIGAILGATAGLATPEVLAAEEAAAIQTPYALEVQSTSTEAQAALGEAQNGATLYRTGTLGSNMAGESQYWSLQNPLTSSEYAGQMGVPSGAPNFVLSGTLNPGASVITNEAAALGSNAGGGIQVVTSPGGVGNLTFTMPYP